MLISTKFSAVLSLLFILNLSYATTFSVTNLNASGNGSFAQALADAKADLTASGFNPHIIDIIVSGTIDATHTDDYDNHIEIRSNNNSTTISVGSTGIPIGTYLVSIKNIALQFTGDGISNGGNLSMTNCRIENTTANTYLIRNRNSLRLQNCTFKNNTGITTVIYNERGLIDIKECVFSNNNLSSGSNNGLIYNVGTALVENCNFINNIGASQASIVNVGNLSLLNCDIVNNNYSGIKTSTDRCSIDRCTISDNNGTGVINDGQKLSILSSTIDNNLDIQGGGNTKFRSDVDTKFYYQFKYC